MLALCLMTNERKSTRNKRNVQFHGFSFLDECLLHLLTWQVLSRVEYQYPHDSLLFMYRFSLVSLFVHHTSTFNFPISFSFRRQLYHVTHSLFTDLLVYFNQILKKSIFLFYFYQTIKWFFYSACWEFPPNVDGESIPSHLIGLIEHIERPDWLLNEMARNDWFLT